MRRTMLTAVAHRGRTALVAAVVLVAAIGSARADDRAAPAAAWLCAPPRSGPFDECTKGNSMGEDDVARCHERQAKRPRRPSRFRVDRGPWIEYPRKGWRCVALPADHEPFITVENRGRAYASWRLRAGDRRCASGVLDLAGPNFYGAVVARCSRRKRLDRDERLPAASAAPAPAAPAASP